MAAFLGLGAACLNDVRALVGEGGGGGVEYLQKARKKKRTAYN